MSASGAVHSPAQVTGTTSKSVERAVMAARSPLSSRASSERQDFFGGVAGVLAGLAGPPCGFAAGVTVGVGVSAFDVGAVLRGGQAREAHLRDVDIGLRRFQEFELFVEGPAAALGFHRGRIIETGMAGARAANNAIEIGTDLVRSAL